ncbi:HGGxSTG domain-containing protein [Luteimonas sp. A611]
MSLGTARLQRVRCGAKRHRDGKPCRAMSEPGKKRCRFHGGKSTGPRTPEGKAKCAANLPSRRAG